MRPILLAGLALTLGGCAQASPPLPNSNAPPRSTAGAEEVIAVAEGLFSAMRTRDTAAIRNLFVPETRIVALRVGGASTAAPQWRSISEFITSIGRSGDELRERMWDPRVEIDGDLAALWAPYDFYLGERFSHCGSDAFHFVRRGGEWKIAALTYTVQTAGCTGPG